MIKINAIQKYFSKFPSGVSRKECVIQKSISEDGSHQFDCKASYKSFHKLLTQGRVYSYHGWSLVLGIKEEIKKR